MYSNIKISALVSIPLRAGFHKNRETEILYRDSTIFRSAFSQDVGNNTSTETRKMTWGQEYKTVPNGGTKIQFTLPQLVNFFALLSSKNSGLLLCYLFYAYNFSLSSPGNFFPISSSHLSLRLPHFCLRACFQRNSSHPCLIDHNHTLQH
jgi:hypothetical protein